MPFPTFECLASSLLILLIGDVFHPISDGSIQPLLNCDVGHSGCGRSAMPVPFAWLKPNGVSRSHLLDWAAGPPNPATTSGDDQSLTKRIRMPCGTRAGIKSDVCSETRTGSGL